ncbi:MAG: hypothetical protein WBA43_07310 [Elainellaceae cyanobacterium]
MHPQRKQQFKGRDCRRQFAEHPTKKVIDQAMIAHSQSVKAVEYAIFV